MENSKNQSTEIPQSVRPVIEANYHTKILFITLIICTLNLCSFNTFSQSAKPIDQEKALLYYMKIFNKVPSEHMCKTNYLEFYLKTFDPINYKNNKNDEFARDSYFRAKSTKLASDITNLSYDQKYTVDCPGTFGEYSTTENSFPINYDCWGPTIFEAGIGDDYLATCKYFIYLKYTQNFDRFPKALRIDLETAKSFVQRRKRPDGKVDRSIYLRKTYSITPYQRHASFNDYEIYFSAYVYSIEIFEDASMLKKLGTLTAEEDFKYINGRKVGTETVKSYWKMNQFGTNLEETKNSFDAQFFRIAAYDKGNVRSDTVVSYYFMSGKPYWLFPAVNLDPNQYGTGTYVKYYDQLGHKEEEYDLVNGKKNGTYIKWLKTGKKIEQVNFINDQKDGCDCKWSMVTDKPVSILNRYTDGKMSYDLDNSCQIYCKNLSNVSSITASNNSSGNSNDGDSNSLTNAPEPLLATDIIRTVPKQINNGDNEIILISSLENNKIILNMHLEKCFKNDPKNKTLLVEKLRKSFEKNLEIDEMDPSLYTNAIGDTVDFYIDFPEPQISYKQTGTYYSSFQKKTFAMEVCTVSLSVLLFNKEGNLLGKKSFDLISRQPYGDRNEALTSALKDKYINNIPEFINPHLK